MAHSDEICKLVIKNIALLEEAPRIIEEIENNIFKAINERFESFFENHDTWKGVYTYNEDDGETSVAPNAWPENNKNEYLAYYSFQLNELADEGSNYLLADILGETTLCQFVIGFGVDRVELFGMNKKTWKDFLLKRYLAMPELEKNGVKIKDESLIIPIRLDPILVEKEYPDDFDESLRPIDAALATLMKIHPLIDNIVQEALNQKNGGVN